MEALKACLKRILSYRERAWNLHDYPIGISEQKAEVGSGQEHEKLPRLIDIAQASIAAIS